MTTTWPSIQVTRSHIMPELTALGSLLVVLCDDNRWSLRDLRGALLDVCLQLAVDRREPEEWADVEPGETPLFSVQLRKGARRRLETLSTWALGDMRTRA